MAPAPRDNAPQGADFIDCEKSDETSLAAGAAFPARQ